MFDAQSAVRKDQMLAISDFAMNFAGGGVGFVVKQGLKQGVKQSAKKSITQAKQALGLRNKTKGKITIGGKQVSSKKSVALNRDKTVTGPRGGKATNTNKTNQRGEPIYQRDSGGFYSVDKKTGKQVSEKSPYPHGNKVGNQRAECYSLQCRRSGQVKKYGETTHGESRYGVGNQKRYSKKWLKENKVRYKKQATGTKRQMKALQTKKIKEHTKVHGKRPDLNKTDQ